MTSTDNNCPANWNVRRVLETGSTNTDLIADALVGAPSHSALMADNQTAGRGRLDRTWEAEPGTNLLVSLLFRSEPEMLKSWPRIVAIAAVRACEEFISQNKSKSQSLEQVKLKWPNDLLLGDRKLGGMLSVGDQRKQFIVVGIGVNIGWAPPDAAKLSDVASEKCPQPVEFLNAMLQQITKLENLSSDDQHQQYVKLLLTLGRQVRVELINGTVVTGLASELDLDGRLIVIETDSQSTQHIIDTGDVVHLRNANHD